MTHERCHGEKPGGEWRGDRAQVRAITWRDNNGKNTI